MDTVQPPRRIRPPRHRDAMVLAVLTLILLEAMLVAAAAGSHPFRLIGTLTPGGVSALAVIAALGIAHRAPGMAPAPHAGRAPRATRAHPSTAAWLQEAGELDESWFLADVAPFPADAVRPLLRQRTIPSNLRVAWVFAVHHHNAAWLDRHLALPPGVADVLVAAAHRPPAATDPTGRPRPERPQTVDPSRN
jgi:hypothetical protein